MTAKIILAVDPQGTSTVIITVQADLRPVLYDLIHCDAVDAVYLTDRLTLWLDDEGMIHPNPIANIPVSLMAARNYGTTQYFFGTAVFTGGATEDGDTLGLTDTQLADLKVTLAHLQQPS